MSEYGIQMFGRVIDAQNREDDLAERWDHSSSLSVDPDTFWQTGDFDPMSEEETEVMHEFLLASAPMEWNERDHNGNLRWLKMDGSR